MAYKVFHDLILDDVPMERVCFDSTKGELKVELDQENNERIILTFEVVKGIRFVPSVIFDRSDLFIDDEYYKTILEIENSTWIEELNQAEERAYEPITRNIRHFAIPSDEGVWEILAMDCRKM